MLTSCFISKNMVIFSISKNLLVPGKIEIERVHCIISGHLFMGGLCCFFKKVLFTNFFHFYDLDLLLTTLTTLFRKTTLKMDSLETTLTTLIYIKNSFITDYADNGDIQNNMKNSFITEFADYPIFNTK